MQNRINRGPLKDVDASPYTFIGEWDKCNPASMRHSGVVRFC